MTKPDDALPATDAASPAKGERIARRLSRAGIASRRDAERMIAEGRVAVNGAVITTPAFLVTPADRIVVDGTPVEAPEPARLWLYHKPSGLVTSARDEKGRATVFDSLPADLPRVMPVGRLDLTSEGLLLLTNDGALKRRLELPSTGWLRKYRVRVKGVPEERALEPLRKGIEIEGERFQPMTVTLDRQQGANAWLTVALREGRNREIRRAMEAVGLVVNRLIRISYGPFQLGTLEPGAVEEVRPRVLRDQLGIDHPAEEGTAKAKPAKARGKSGGGSGPRSPKPDQKPSRTGGKPGKTAKTATSTQPSTQRPDPSSKKRSRPGGSQASGASGPTGGGAPRPRRKSVPRSG
jgi:23S rRNA pseudouridine2605 synthase